MSAPVTTTYRGHRVSIEPFEWGYVSEIEFDGDRRIVCARPTAFEALERAFEMIDGLQRVGAASIDQANEVSNLAAD